MHSEIVMIDKPTKKHRGRPRLAKVEEPPAPPPAPPVEILEKKKRGRPKKIIV